MKVRINGVEEVLSAKTMTLQELVVGRGLSPTKVVIEVNLRITSRDQWPQIILQDKDCIEIISFVGGG